MLTAALTGGIGAGKSAALAVFESLGAHVFRLDEISREVLAPGAPAVADVARLWPEAVRAGAVDRDVLGRIVFGDETARADLEAIVHPTTWDRLDGLLAEADRRGPGGVAVFELALLAGSPRQDWAHINLAVEAGAELRLARLEGERGMDASDARARMATQASEDAYARICDAVILNDSSLAEFELKLTEIWEGRLVPYALNLSEGRRIGAKGPQASSGRLLHATRRAQARLECHGVAAAVKAPGQLEILSKAPETAMRAAGFVPDEPGYASADPVVLVRARMRDA